MGTRRRNAISLSVFPIYILCINKCQNTREYQVDDIIPEFPSPFCPPSVALNHLSVEVVHALDKSIQIYRG